MNESRVASSFATHFAEKINLNVAKARVDVNSVHNGKCYFLLMQLFIENFKTLAKGQEPKLYVAPMFCWSFLHIYHVKLKGP